MWNGILNSTQITALEQTVEFAQRRHSILAGNVANMSTPGYKTRDLSVDDFQTNLRQALHDKERVQGLQSQGALQTPSEKRNVQLQADRSLQKVRDSMTQVLYHDGSDDSIEQQVTEIAKNQSMHSMATTLLRSQFQTLQVAISESVNA